MEPEQKPSFDERQGPVPITEAIRDAQVGFRHLLRSELHLATVELKTALVSLGHRSKLMLVFGTLAIWSILPLTAFLVIGLGALLNDNYWLSSLILAALALAIGVTGIMLQIKRARHDDMDEMALRRTRRTINRKLRRVV